MVFLEKCSLLVDRLGHTSECYVEVQRKGGTAPPPPLATPLVKYLALVLVHKTFVGLTSPRLRASP